MLKIKILEKEVTSNSVHEKHIKIHITNFCKKQNSNTNIRSVNVAYNRPYSIY